MAAAEPHSPSKSKKLSTSSSQTRNDSENPWLVIPNNLELGARAKPSKKQRNKEKHRQFEQGNLPPPSEVTDSISCKPKPSLPALPQAKTATWVKEQYVNEKKSKQRAYESDEDEVQNWVHDFDDSDCIYLSPQNVHFAANQTIPGTEQRENQVHSLRCGGENENVKSVQGEFKKKEAAMVYDVLNQMHNFISEAESSWHLDVLSDEPIFKDAFVKLKNAVKDVEGGKENKLLHNSATENEYGSGMSPSSSISGISNSKENTVNRDITGNAMDCNKEEKRKKYELELMRMWPDKTDCSSSDLDPIDDVGSAVQWENRLLKLKNKLAKLQEENTIKGELLLKMTELYKNAANADSTSADAKHPRTKEKKKRKTSKLQSVSQSIKQPKAVPIEDIDISSMTDTPAITLDSRYTRPSTSAKRDNVKKEQNSFPARRHYEAEGRANEEPDIPAGSAPAVSPDLDNGEIKDKIKKLKVAHQHVKVLKAVVGSMIETRKAGVEVPVDQLHLPTSKKKVNPYFSESDEDSYRELPSSLPSSLHFSSLEPAATNVKEVYQATIKSLIDADSHRQGECEVVADNLETTVGKKEDLTKLHSQFNKLMQIFPPSDRKNDDSVRSSGEGAYTLRKIPTRNVVSEHAQKKHCLRTVPHQDNLQLTRQNIATMESQSQNSNLHNRDCNSVKKDNINNLSGKMGKLSIQNSMNSSYPDVLAASNNNMDSTSIFSYELNQTHSVPNEVERKNIFDILKRDKKKQKQYDRNQDNKGCCNSSVDSEPFEGSTSALAYDSTTLGAWGGSSTQENLDDNEEQEFLDEDISYPDFEKVSPRSLHPTSQYSNMQQYIDSVANVSDKKQRNFHHQSYNRNQNQPAVQTGSQQHSPQEVKTVRQRFAPASPAGSSPREMRDNATCSNDTSDHIHQQRPSKFMQQLLSHVDQLNALCQNQIYHERPQASINSLSSQNYGHVPSTSAPLQPSLELPFPYNQQLLLCLSQCYHALYMQQLEIHHLQRCMWQNVEGDNSHQQNYFNARSNHEDTSFRPYCAPSWSNPFIPSAHFHPEQGSPVSSGPYFHLPTKPYANPNTGAQTSSGTQPARAVIHPTSQNNTAAQETLNNQVPPRTRANNFWDNFRSYSRQNLLSTSNTAKRNENVASLVAPQVRQVFPLVTNASLNRSADTSSACCTSSSFSEYNRAPPNPEDTAAKNVKFNTPIAGTVGSSKKGVPTIINIPGIRKAKSRSQRANFEPALLQSSSNCSSSASQQQSLLQENTVSRSLSTNASNSVSCPARDAAAAVTNTTQEITSMLPTDHQSDFLIGLMSEARTIKSDALRRKALRMIRDLAMSERHDVDEVSQHKIQNDSTNSLAELERASGCMSNQHCLKICSDSTVLLPDAMDNERTSFQLSSENPNGCIQTLPTAAIPPLSKHGTPKTVSTGAVRKKKIPSVNLSESASNGPVSIHDSSSSTTVNINPPIALPTVEEIPAFVTEKVIADLTALLPSLRRRFLRDGCTQTYWTLVNDCLVESVRTHMFFCNINLSRKCLLRLRETVYLFISLFTVIPLTDIDFDWVKWVEEFTYENIVCYVSSGEFSPIPAALIKDGQMIRDDRMSELCVKMPSETSEAVNIKMPLRTYEEPSEFLSVKMPIKVQEESVESIIMKDSPVPSEENFSPRCTPIQLQNLVTIENFIPEVAVALSPAQEHVEDLRCDCNPEGEIEPEVEIGTEADLAEADQSPGQQGPGIGETVPVPEIWSLDHEIVLQRSSAILLLNGDEPRDIGDPSESASAIQMCSDACLDQEAILDDIPTKLCPSEEELPQQLKDEQPIQLSSDDAASQSEFAAENDDDNGLTMLR